jgi:hypothetical protein
VSRRSVLCDTAEPGPTCRRSTSDQQRTRREERRAAQHPENAVCKDTRIKKKARIKRAFELTQLNATDESDQAVLL